MRTLWDDLVFSIAFALSRHRTLWPRRRRDAPAPMQEDFTPLAERIARQLRLARFEIGRGPETAPHGTPETGAQGGPAERGSSGAPAARAPTGSARTPRRSRP